MPRRRDEDPADLPPEESSVTQYDSPSDSTHDSERSSQSGHTTHSTSLHSGRSRRLAAPVPVHAQGLYRADGLEYRQLPPAGAGGAANLRRAPSTRGVRDMYDPELHDEPPLPPNNGKDAVSGDSLSYGSQPEYVHYVNPPPLSGIGPYSWADSTSGTSQELYFRGQRKYFKRSFCSVCLSVSIVSVIIAVIGIVAIAAYLGVMTTDDSEAMKYEMQYSGKFRVARGDFFHPMLADTSSVDFQDKAERYQKMIETLYGYSYLSDAFRRASVERFGNDSLTVFFRVHLDRRKIPTSVLNTEEAVRDVVTQEVMSLEPRAFRSISVDIDSIEIKREQKDGVSTAPFVSRGGGGSRLQEIEPEGTGPEDTYPTTEVPGQDGAPSDTTTASDEQPDTTDGPKDESAEPDSQVEPAMVQPSTEKGAGGKTMLKEEIDKSQDPAAAPEANAKGQMMDQENSSDKEQMTSNNPGDKEKPATEGVGPTEAEGPKTEVTELESKSGDAPAEEMTKEAELDQAEAATEVAETGTKDELDASQNNAPAESVSDPSDLLDRPLENHPQGDHVPTDPEHRTSSDSSPVDVSTTDPSVVDPSPLDIKQGNGNDDVVTEDTASYDIPESFYYDDDFYDVTTEGAIASDPADQSIPYEVIDQPSSYEPSAPISDEVATELAPFLAASVPQGVNRVGYVDPSAPANAPGDVKLAQPPSYSDFADVQVGTAYFGGLAPAPTATAAPAPPAVWAQLGDSGPASVPAPAPAPAPVPSPAGQQDNWPQLQRPAPATDSNDDESPLYDFSPWNPIIPAFVQAGGQTGRPGSLFVDGGGVRRGGEYPPAVTVQPRPNLNGAAQVFAADDVATDVEVTPAPEVTTSRRPFIGVAEQQQAGENQPASGRPQYASIPIPESVSIQQTLQILPEDGDADPRPSSNLGSAETLDRLSSANPIPVGGSRPESLIINRPRPRPRPRPSNRPAARPFTTDYRTEVSTSEISEESQAAPGGTALPGALADLASLLEPAGGVDRLGIAFITRPAPTRQPVTAPTATTTQRVVVVNAAPAASDAGPAVEDVTPSRPELPPVTTFSGVYPPLLRPRPSSSSGSGTPTQQQAQLDQTESLVGGADPVVVSAVPDAGFQPLRPRPALPAGGASGVLAGALGGALSGAPDGPSAPGDVSAPSREQLLNLFRLIALRYPALVANMDQQQLQLLLNDEEARRKLLAPFLAADKSRTPGEPQRTNTKLLELANISINGTRLDRRDDGRSLRREVPSRAYGNSAPPPPPRRGEFSRLSSSVLQALANFTRVKVAGGSPSGSSNEASGEASGETDAVPERLPTGPAGSLSDRLHQLAGFPTRAPPHRGNVTTPGSSRSKLSHKLMRFHGERTNADGGCTDPTDFACRTLGGCVPASSRCDRLLDCADGSDERDCTCADRLRAQALHSKLCDGVVDCHDSSDEKFCEWCRPDQFICPEAKQCVDRSALCDGRFDCADGADERHCVTLAESATHAETGDGLYSDSGLLLVRKRGVWGRLCVDQLDGVVRQSRGSWGADELGRAVCKALTYQDAKGVKSVGPNVTDSEVEATEDPFFKLLFSPNTVLPEAEKASLVFAEDSCPRQSALHVTCDTLQCGLRPRVKQRQARIVGGGNSSPGAWPWQAAMYRDGEYQCGATLISDRWLLSAGHCYLRSTTRYWLARLGAYRRGSSLLSPYERLHEVSHVIMHPEYQDVGYVHDIALLRLREPVQMSDFVRPACLPPPKTEIQNGALCTVVGWGQLFESGKIFPDTLQEVQVPLISSQECKKRTVFLPLYKITENMFCAGYERGGRDACLGDSGGPLMCQEASGEWTLTGITSNGYGCARAGRPGVYTKVSNYASWMDDVIGGSLPPAPRHACRGHRCRLGRCLSPDEVCDGIVHCSDGGDEEECPANSTTTLPASAEGQSQQL